MQVSLNCKGWIFGTNSSNIFKSFALCGAGGEHQFKISLLRGAHPGPEGSWSQTEVSSC